MNLRNFKKEIEKRNLEKELFSEFRLASENIYKKYKVYKEKAFSNLGQSDRERELKREWENVEYGRVVDMFTKMELSVVDNLIPETIYVKFDDVYAEIRSFSDDVEYTYALLEALKDVKRDSALYRGFVREFYIKMREYGLEECRRLIKSRKKPKAFIAMWFDERMLPIRQQIEYAVSDCGYEPIVVDEQEYNGQIMEYVYREIDESYFVIAELTGNRGGVYYEAGYAEGKGKELILCCMKGEETHFDVKQVNTIFWGNESAVEKTLDERLKEYSENQDVLKEIYEGLIKRIEETVGSY